MNNDNNMRNQSRRPERKGENKTSPNTGRKKEVEELDPEVKKQMWIGECYEELLEAGEVFSGLGMHVTTHNASETISVPVLVIALREVCDELLAVDISFSPYEKDALTETKLLQIGVEFPFDIPLRDTQKIPALLNRINAYVPVGHFSLLDTVLYYRFVCPIPKTMRASSMTVLESISMVSVFASNYEEIFRKYVNKKITFDELYAMVTQK